jgi:peroxiredoxin Q/BCP
MSRNAPIGSPAPDFELDGTEGRFRLSDHRGERVVLLFYPGDYTPVCTRQFCSYRSDEFDGLDATIVGISEQSLDSHQRFTSRFGLNVPLLADAGGGVAKAYGVRAPVIGTRRSVVIVDEQGIIRFRHDHRTGLSYLGTDELREALASLPAQPAARAE